MVCGTTLLCNLDYLCKGGDMLEIQSDPIRILRQYVIYFTRFVKYFCLIWTSRPTNISESKNETLNSPKNFQIRQKFYTALVKHVKYNKIY